MFIFATRPDIFQLSEHRLDMAPLVARDADDTTGLGSFDGQGVPRIVALFDSFGVFQRSPLEGMVAQIGVLEFPVISNFPRLFSMTIRSMGMHLCFGRVFLRSGLTTKILARSCHSRKCRSLDASVPGESQGTEDICQPALDR